ncbi:hypothetical protein ABEB36_011764 [Hypothenemus hampei]|uniref:Ku70/Ku80 N-terminal alpha/beta domain-containing protein n=1 Tax=Hypothenemus hampei TaxID=57062 RepID=A0ABD1E8Y3_HYPHA
MEDAENATDYYKETAKINFKPSFVLITIDTHPSMFVPKIDEDDAESCPFKDILLACYEVADSLVLSTSRSNYNQFGILLADEDGKATLVNVQNNLLDTIKFLKELSSQSIDYLKTKYQRDANLDLAALFLLCKKKLREINSEYYKSTILFITNHDDPTKDSPQMKYAAINEVKSFAADNIIFELVTMTDSFDYTLFYNELFYVYSSQPPVEEIYPDKYGIVKKLSSLITYSTIKSRLKLFPFSNDHTKFLKVMKMNLARKAKLLNTHTVSIDGKMVMKVKPDPAEQAIYATDLNNGQRLEITSEERLRVFSDALPIGFHLQFVADRQTDIGMIIHKTSILVLDPHEELEGYFNQFWQYCVDNSKVLVCLNKVRLQESTYKTRYVELIPKYGNNSRLFLIKYIPFCDEVKLPKSLLTTQRMVMDNVDDEQKEAVKQLINDLTCDYDSQMFINPMYGRKKAYIKSKLLDLPAELVDDVTADSEENINEQIAETVTKIKTLFSISDVAQQGKKRKTINPSVAKKSRK